MKSNNLRFVFMSHLNVIVNITLEFLKPKKNLSSQENLLNFVEKSSKQNRNSTKYIEHSAYKILCTMCEVQSKSEFDF